MNRTVIKTLIVFAFILPLSVHAFTLSGLSTQVQSLADTLEQIKKALAQRGYTPPIRAVHTTAPTQQNSTQSNTGQTQTPTNTEQTPVTQTTQQITLPSFCTKQYPYIQLI